MAICGGDNIVDYLSGDAAQQFAAAHGGYVADEFGSPFTPNPPINHAPFIDYIPYQTVEQGGTLSFQVTASDPDVGQTLTFSLHGDVPAGASISSSGLFTWTPTDEQAGNFYQIGVEVADNSSIPLRDSLVFDVSVAQLPAPTAFQSSFFFNGGIDRHPPYFETAESLVLTWQLVDNAEGYVIQRQAYGGDWATLGYPTTGRFTDTTIRQGVKYQYRVAALSGSVISDYSPPLAVLTPLTIASFSSLQQVGTSASVAMTWLRDTFHGPVAGYIIERLDSPEQGWQTIASVNGLTSSYVDNTVQLEHYYKYRITPYTTDEMGEAFHANGCFVLTVGAYGYSNGVSAAVADLHVFGVPDQTEATIGGVVALNDNFDEQNHDAEGHLVPDNQPDAVAGDRIRISQYLVNDNQLTYAEWNYFISVWDDISPSNPYPIVSGKTTLTFSNKIKVWTVSGIPGNPYIQVQSGMPFSPDGDYYALEGDLRLWIEGISPSDTAGDVFITATFTPDNFAYAPFSDTVRLTVVGVNNLTVTEDAYQSNSVTTSDATQPKLYALADDNGQSVIDLSYTGSSAAASANLPVLWSVSGQGITSKTGAFSGTTANVTLKPSTPMQNAARLAVVSVGADANHNGNLDPDEVARTVDVYLVPQLNIQYTAFIMEPWVDNPIANFPDRIFQGDDRTDASEHAIFDKNSNRYRARIGFTVIPSEAQSANGVEDNSFVASTGWTYKYNKVDSLDANGNLTATALADTIVGDTVLKTDMGHAGTEGMTIHAQRTYPETVTIQIDSATHNPLIPGLISPDIDFHVTLTIDFSNPLAPAYSLVGSYDAFPCTELYVNNQLILYYDTKSNGTGSGSLIGSGGVTVNKLGNLI